MMERDVNLKLIYIILVLLLALAGTSFFYHMRYEDMKSGYERSFKEMNHTLKNIMNEQKDLYYNISELNISANREVTLAARLESKTVELENMNRELSTIQQQLFECQQNYILLNTNFDRLHRMINKLETDINNNESKSVIDEDIKNIRNELIMLKNY